MSSDLKLAEIYHEGLGGIVNIIQDQATGEYFVVKKDDPLYRRRIDLEDGKIVSLTDGIEVWDPRVESHWVPTIELAERIIKEVQTDNLTPYNRGISTKHPFEYQKPTDEQVKKITEVREAMKSVYELLLTLPASRERSVAITKLEESSMWANKGIVFN